MDGETLDGQLGVTLAIDVCRTCHVFWFDPHEDLQLAPSAVLQLFQIITKQSDAAPAAAPTPGSSPACPRCGLRLLETHDMQRATKFEYLRCARGHGRLMTFLNFLLEKDFIHPLSSEQIAELRDRNIQVISCSKCGAPVDLTRGSTCAHCGAALSMLDVGRLPGLQPG